MQAVLRLPTARCFGVPHPGAISACRIPHWFRAGSPRREPPRRRQPRTRRRTGARSLGSSPSVRPPAAWRRAQSCWTPCLRRRGWRSSSSSTWRRTRGACWRTCWLGTPRSRSCRRRTGCRSSASTCMSSRRARTCPSARASCACRRGRRGTVPPTAPGCRSTPSCTRWPGSTARAPPASSCRGPGATAAPGCGRSRRQAAWWSCRTRRKQTMTGCRAARSPPGWWTPSCRSPAFRQRWPTMPREESAAQAARHPTTPCRPGRCLG